MPQEPARKVGPYEIVRQIDRGGMALVFLARQENLDRSVALKLLNALPADDPELAARFVQEARVASSLTDPNIVTTYEYFVHDGRAYIAMEYLRNGSLRKHVRSLSLPQIGGVLESHAGRARPRAHPRDRPPRPQARERPGHRPRRLQAGGLRDRQGAQQRRDARLPDAHRAHGRHAVLHGARAGAGRRGERPDGPLLGRRDGLRDGHAPASVRPRGPLHADADHARPHPGRVPAAGCDRTEPGPAAGRVGRADDVARPGEPPGKRRGGLPGARGGHRRARGPAVAAPLDAGGHRRRAVGLRHLRRRRGGPRVAARERAVVLDPARAAAPERRARAGGRTAGVRAGDGQRIRPGAAAPAARPARARPVRSRVLGPDRRATRTAAGRSHPGGAGAARRRSRSPSAVAAAG